MSRLQNVLIKSFIYFVDLKIIISTIKEFSECLDIIATYRLQKFYT